MRFHNILILCSYFLLALAVLWGLAFKIALPAFLTLPVGILQIWSMNRIAAGAKPNWLALTLTALALFGFTSYFLAFAFWL
jgi:hypothetical protein